MNNLEWPHLEVFRAACRIDAGSEEYSQLIENSSEWVRIFKSLKNYIFAALCDRDQSEIAIEILETFTSIFKEIRNECLEESLNKMIKALQHIYKPDIDNECRENIKKYF
jgi:hypothetical protein